MKKDFQEFKNYIKGKKVAVVGVGVSTIPLIKFLVELGASVTAFDKNTEEKLIALRREMTNAGYASSEWPPHITLAAYEDLDAEALCDWTGEFVREHTRQKLTFGSVSLLPPYATHRETAVLCLNPVHAKPFVDFYYAFHEK